MPDIDNALQNASKANAHNTHTHVFVSHRLLDLSVYSKYRMQAVW